MGCLALGKSPFVQYNGFGLGFGALISVFVITPLLVNCRGDILSIEGAGVLSSASYFQVLFQRTP